LRSGAAEERRFRRLAETGSSGPEIVLWTEWLAELKALLEARQ
jgi:hypothetical protein